MENPLTDLIGGSGSLEPAQNDHRRGPILAVIRCQSGSRRKPKQVFYKKGINND